MEARIDQQRPNRCHQQEGCGGNHHPAGPYIIVRSGQGNACDRDQENTSHHDHINQGDLLPTESPAGQQGPRDRPHLLHAGRPSQRRRGQQERAKSDENADHAEQVKEEYEVSDAHLGRVLPLGIPSVYLLSAVEDFQLKLGVEAETIPGFLLWQVAKLWQRHLTLALQDLKLPSTQAVILANVLRLTEEGRPVTQAMLSEATKVDRMTASQALRSLELKRYITRRRAPGDRRANRVVLTASGRRVALVAIKRFASTHDAFFEPLGDGTSIVAGYLQQLIRRNEIAAVESPG